MEKRNLETLLLNGCLYDKYNADEILRAGNGVGAWQEAVYHFLTEWFNDSEKITIHTSGSTGTPKAIELTKTAMRNSARMTNAFFGLNNTASALLCLPASYIAGKMMLVRAMVGDFNLIAVEPSANPFSNLNQYIDFAAITPYQLQNSLEEIQKIENRKLKIGKIIVGGAKINSKTEATLQSLSTVFYETYGMTETCSHIALRAVNGPRKSDYFEALNGVSIRTNEKGCLCISAPHLLPDEIVTTDMVQIQNQTAFKWLGRLDNIINSGGIKINPEAVEQKLAKHIAQPFFISSVPDELLGHKPVLVIESAPYTEQAEAALQAAIDTSLTKYERPKTILYIPQFRYSASNKILKAESLRQ